MYCQTNMSDIETLEIVNETGNPIKFTLEWEHSKLRLHLFDGDESKDDLVHGEASEVRPTQGQAGAVA